jgi:hypothetical protein
LENDTPIPSHFHSATHTILDLEETLAQPGFKNPKSMKDIEKIFGSMYPKDTEGFFKIPTPLVEPEHLKNAPDGFSPQTLADHFPGRFIRFLL